LAIIGAVFSNGFVKNKVLEFIGDGISNLPIEFRNGIDVMTTETSCLSSIWATDDETRRYFEIHRRPEAFKYLAPGETAYYDCAVDVDLSAIESMIALPFHPSNAVTIRELCADPDKYLNLPDADLRDKITPDGKILVEQGVIAGCAGGIYDNLCAAADIIRGRSIGCGEFGLSVYPASQPVFSQLLKNGVAETLITAGAIMRTAFCGPCFGAGDVPSNGGLSIRHSTRNFPNREGSKPSGGQSAFVALMDARSIAATAVNGGILTAADTLDVKYNDYPYSFDDSAYVNRVYNGCGKPDAGYELKIGPNIADWPEQKALGDNVILPVAAIIDDPVTTTDELIPSGETSSYRSNPLKLAEFALSRKDPKYVQRAKDIMNNAVPENVMAAARRIAPQGSIEKGSMIYANRPGDGSAREQAASCQRVLGGLANLCIEYATKRYRSNLINWGMLPFNCDCDEIPVALGDYLFVPKVREAVEAGAQKLAGYVISPDASVKEITLRLPPLTADERDIILAGCLINYYKTRA
ncbi:MAG: hydratase, partial [Eubacteriales bacterium]